MARQHCKPTDFDCIMLWRPMTAQDIRDFEDRFKRQQTLLATDEAPVEIPEDDALTAEARVTPGSEPLPLIAHLTRDGWPSDFVTIVGTYSACGGGYDFAYYPRQLVLDVAIIENASSQPIAIGEILGASTSGGLETPARRTRRCSRQRGDRQAGAR